MGSLLDNIGPSTGFATTCSISVRNAYSTAGSATRARISPLTPAQIKAIYVGSAVGSTTEVPIEGWRENGAMLKHQLEMQACGVRRNTLYEWLMSSNKPGNSRLVNIQKISKGPSLIAPFILGAQKSLWNADHWGLAGNADATAGGADDNLPVAGTGGNRVLTVESSFGGTMELHADYFIPGKNLHLMARGAGGIMTVTQFKIVQAGVNSDASQVDVEVRLNQPAYGTPQAGEASASFPTAATVQSGVIFLGINNVQDVESWCRNMINVNLNKRVPFWFQTRRRTREVDEQYSEFFDHMMKYNEWYSIFGDLPMAERNRQDEARDQTEWMHAFFFGERISKYQTLDKWELLDKVTSVTGGSVDPGTGGAFMGFRANMIGVLPLLKDCGRIIDNAGNPSGFPIKGFLENDIWDVVRARRSQNRKADEIDIYTDEGTADEFMTAYIEYSKSKTGDIARINIDQGVSEWGFPFRRLRLYKPIGVSINLITDDFFNDIATAASYSTSGSPHGAGAAGLGKFLMVLDLGQGGTIYPSVIASNRKQHTVGDINDLSKVDATFSCVMENPRIRKTLTSETTTAIVECPANSLIVMNFDKIVSGV